jgi:hypothetical protein
LFNWQDIISDIVLFLVWVCEMLKFFSLSYGAKVASDKNYNPLLEEGERDSSYGGNETGSFSISSRIGFKFRVSSSVHPFNPDNPSFFKYKTTEQRVTPLLSSSEDSKLQTLREFLIS